MFLSWMVPYVWSLPNEHSSNPCKESLFSPTAFSPYNFKSKWATCPQFLICSNVKGFYKFLGNLWAFRYFLLKLYYNNHFKMVRRRKKLVVVEGLSRDDRVRQTWISSVLCGIQVTCLSPWPLLHNREIVIPIRSIITLFDTEAWHTVCAQEMVAFMVAPINHFIYF